MSHECPTCGGPVVPHTDKEGKTRYRRVLVEQSPEVAHISQIEDREERSARYGELIRGYRSRLRVIEP